MLVESDESKQGLYFLFPTNIWNYHNCLLTKITISLRHIPESPRALESLFFTENFDTKHGSVYGKLWLFGSRMKHVVRGWTQSWTLCYLWYLRFLWNLFLWLWIFRKSNLQGEEINPPRKNGANDSSYGAYPQVIVTHEFPLLCCQVRCIKFWFWGFQASPIQSVVWTPGCI